MQGSLEILRQSGWDLWSWVCIAASAVLICYAIFTRLWTSRRGWIALSLIAIGVIGTAIITSTPSLHQPLLGMIWTLVLMALLSATFYLNLHEQLGTRRMVTLLVMRLIALALLVPMLFEPVWRFVQEQPPRKAIYFLIDTSGSMSVPDVANGPTRIQSVWQTLSPLLPKLKLHYLPHFYSFSTGCVELKDPRELAIIAADGKSTNFTAAVNKAATDAGADKDADFILVSDGNDNVSPNVADLIRQSQRKVHTVLAGSTQAAAGNLINAAVDSVAAPRDAAVGHDAKLTATITNTGLANRVVDVNLAEVGDDGKPTGAITSQRLVLQSAPEGQKVDLLYTPHAAGVRRLAVWIDPIPGERNVADNRQDIQLLAIEARTRVLYIEGAARPEFTFLIRLLNHDADVELATLERIQGDRFTADGTVDGRRFLALPATQQAWNDFDVILIGDLDSSFLPPAQQVMIRQRVNDGGGLVMIGGLKNFGAGGYKGSPLEEALPVFVGDLTASQDMEEFVPQLTPEGAAHPILDGLADWFPLPGKTAVKKLAPLKGNVVVLSPKAGAQVLLVHPGSLAPDGKPQIVLAVQQFGKGRSAAFTADTTNIWYRQFREQGSDSVYNRFWGQLIGWLGGQESRDRAKGPGILALLDKSVYSFGQSPRLRVIVRDSLGNTTQFATVSGTLNGPGFDKPLAVPATPVSSQTGEYEAVFPPPGDAGLKAGDYTLDVSATKDGTPLGQSKLKFSVTVPDEEMLKIAADPKTMNDIADQTGGYHRQLSELPELIDMLIATDPDANVGTIQRTVPLANAVRLVLNALGRDVPWPAHSDLPMEGGLVITILVGEWLLRRKWQLP